MVESFGSTKATDSVGAFAGGFVEAIRQPFDGARQLADAKLEHEESSGSAAEMAGKFVGGSALFIGSMLLAKRLPFIGSAAEGKLASVTVGGALGFLTPVGENQGLSERVMNAGVGAGTMSLMEFGPGAMSRMPMLSENTFRNGLIRYGTANAAAGALHTEANSFIQTGHGASAQELAMGTATWGLMGAGLHAAGRPLARMQADQAAARELTAQRPWQFKEVQNINASELSAGQALAPGHYHVKFESQGLDRAFNLYISEKSAAASGTAPVVTFLHGLNPTGQSQKIIRELSFNRFADERGGVVAYLEGAPGHKGPLTGNVQSWKDRNFGYTDHPAEFTDTRTFRDMMNVVGRHVPQANTDSIGVVGFSLGGKMANRIAAENPAVSALATIHGTVDKFDVEQMSMGMNRRPLDAIFILGDKDRVLPEAGGRSLFTMLLKNSGLSRPHDQAGFWSQRLGGSADSLVTQAPEYIRRDWFSPAGASPTRVTEYVVKDGHHAIDGAHAKKNLTQFLMGEPKPSDYFDARRRVFNFVWRALEENKGAETKTIAAASA